jgi:hypothetical protein
MLRDDTHADRPPLVSPLPASPQEPLAYASLGGEVDPWRHAARAWAVFALMVGIVRLTVCALRVAQAFGPRIGMVRRRVLLPREVWVGALYLTALLCSLVLVIGALAFLINRRGRVTIVIAALLLASLSVILAIIYAAGEVANYRLSAALPPVYVLNWVAIRALEGLAEAMLFVVLAWPFLKLK